MKIKELFDKAEDGKLTYEQYEALVKESGAKFTDLSEGNYVSKSKYDADLKAKDTELESFTSQIEQLNGTIATRDKDLGSLQKKLEAAGQDATKLAELNTQLADMQSKYEADMQKQQEEVQRYQEQLKQQAYDFAVSEFAGTQKFSSQAAKRDFIQAMKKRQLQMEDGKILGRDDYLAKYREENADAFYVEPPKVEPPTPKEPEPTPPPVPQIVAPTPGPAVPTGEEFDFGFLGVREH